MFYTSSYLLEFSQYHNMPTIEKFIQKREWICLEIWHCKWFNDLGLQAEAHSSKLVKLKKCYLWLMPNSLRLILIPTLICDFDVNLYLMCILRKQLQNGHTMYTESIMLKYVMRSKGISLKSNIWFSVFYLIEVLIYRGILLKIPPEVDQWFQSHKQWKDSQNNRKQKKLIPFSGNLTINAPNFQLIPLDRNTYYAWFIHYLIFMTKLNQSELPT